jgi:hypothetical protein
LRPEWDIAGRLGVVHDSGMQRILMGAVLVIGSASLMLVWVNLAPATGDVVPASAERWFTLVGAIAIGALGLWHIARGFAQLRRPR